MENEEEYFKEYYKKEKLEIDNDIFAHEDDRRGRPEFFMPPGTEVLKLESYLEIDVGLRSKDKRFRRVSAIFSIIWNLIAGTIMFVSVTGNIPMGMAITSVFLIVGFILFIQTLKLYINKKKVIIENGKIKISEKPINLFTRYLEIPTTKIKQLYTSKYFTGVTVNDQRIMAYSLSAVTDDNKIIRLVKESNIDTVLYLEQEIERFLDIKDEAVYGEILKKDE